MEKNREGGRERRCRRGQDGQEDVDERDEEYICRRRWTAEERKERTGEERR